MNKGFGDSDYKGTEYVLNGKSKTKTGSVHPEIGKLRRKYCVKDMKLFDKYGTSKFFRDPYENELDLYPDGAYSHLNGKENCAAMLCVKVGEGTRAVLPMSKEKILEHISDNGGKFGIIRDKSLN